jgi:hypothetical protein
MDSPHFSVKIAPLLSGAEYPIAACAAKAQNHILVEGATNPAQLALREKDTDKSDCVFSF